MKKLQRKKQASVADDAETRAEIDMLVKRMIGLDSVAIAVRALLASATAAIIGAALAMKKPQFVWVGFLILVPIFFTESRIRFYYGLVLNRFFTIAQDRYGLVLDQRAKMKFRRVESMGWHRDRTFWEKLFPPCEQAFHFEQVIYFLCSLAALVGAYFLLPAH